MSDRQQMIWIQGGLGGSQLRWLVYHETAHQWFYGLVGSDQAYQPFADEGAGDHLARTVSGIWRSSTCATGRLDLSIYQYSSACYFETIYVQGSLLLQQVHDRMGDAAYWRAMRDYKPPGTHHGQPETDSGAAVPEPLLSHQVGAMGLIRR